MIRAKIFPLGDNALTVDFGNEISAALNDEVLRLDSFINRRNFPGLIETVPAYGSLTVFYDVFTVRKNFPESATAFAAVKNFVETARTNAGEIERKESRLIEIPICFDEEFAPDLAAVAARNDLTKEEVIEIFLARIYRVFMIGFLPGFPYLGEIDERIAAPRRSTPRLKTPKGSVGIAGRQTGIYPLESPGGWQIIGRTPLELFTPAAATPTLLQAGDSVKFHRIEKKKFTTETQRFLRKLQSKRIFLTCFSLCLCVSVV
jgi:inhibitor of KinA